MSSQREDVSVKSKVAFRQGAAPTALRELAAEPSQSLTLKFFCDVLTCSERTRLAYSAHSEGISKNEYAALDVGIASVLPESRWVVLTEINLPAAAVPGHKISVEAFPGLDAGRELARLQSYFLTKVGEVFYDEEACKLLKALYDADKELRAVPYDEIDGITPKAVSLARLSAAGLCQLWQDRVTITPSGRAFAEMLFTRE